jgi:hypothetical protein
MHELIQMKLVFILYEKQLLGPELLRSYKKTTLDLKIYTSTYT